MDLGAIWGKLKVFFGGVVHYFKNFKASLLYKSGDMIYAFVMLIVAVVKTFK